MNRNPLGALRVTSPCSEGWERMIGDDRIRHCEQCDKNVFDLSRFSRDEAETLVGAFRGEFCIRLTRRPDGSIVTSEAETPAAAAFVPIKLRRAGPVAGAALGLVLGVSGAAYAQEPVEIQPVADKPAVVALASKDEVTQSEGAFASVRGTIWGNEFTPTLANVSLVDASTGKFFKTETSANGDYSFTNVPAGEFFLFIEVEHFYPVVKRRVLAAGQVWRANALVDQADVDVMGISGVDRSPRPFSLLRHSDAVAYAKIAKMTEIGSEKYEGENGNPPVEFVNWRMVVQLGNLLKGKGLPTDLAVEQSFIRDETSQPKPGDEVLLFLDGNQGEWRLDTFVQLDAKFHGSPRLADFIQRTRKRTPTRAEFTEWLVQETVNLETRADASIERRDE